MRPADHAVPGQLAGRQQTGRVVRPRHELGRGNVDGRGGRQEQHVAQRARTVQPAVAVAAGDTRGEPPDADDEAAPAPAAQPPVPSEPAVPVAAHAVRPERAGTHVRRAGQQRTVAREPVQLERFRFEEHHVQPAPAHQRRRRPGRLLARRDLVGARAAAVQAAAAAPAAATGATAAVVVAVLRQRSLAGPDVAGTAVPVVAQQRQQTAERGRPVRVRPRVPGVAHAHRHDDDGHPDAHHAVAVPVPDAHAAQEGQVRERRGQAASDEGRVLRVQEAPSGNGSHGIRGKRMLTT